MVTDYEPVVGYPPDPLVSNWYGERCTTHSCGERAMWRAMWRAFPETVYYCEKCWLFKKNNCAPGSEEYVFITGGDLGA